MPQQIAQDRNITGQGDLAVAESGLFAEQTADNNCASIFNQDIGSNLGGTLLRQGEIAFQLDLTGTVFRVQFHADISIVHHIRGEFENGTGL